MTSLRLPRKGLRAPGGEHSGDALVGLLAAEQAITHGGVSPPAHEKGPAVHALSLPDPPTRPRRPDESNADLCDVGPTQDLPDGFFSLYHTQQPQSPTAVPSVASAEAPGDLYEKSVLSTDEAGDGSAGGVRVGRTDCRHAQQSQYVPTSTDDFEEDDAEGEDSAEAAADVPPTAGLTTATTRISPAPTPPPLSRDPVTAATHTAAGTEEPPQDAHQRVYWPHPHPPPPTALPPPQQSRRAFHTRRYGDFIKAYLGLSDVEVERAQRRGRGICMIGVCKAPAPTTASAAPLHSSSDARVKGPTRLGEPVRVRRRFLRHSVLAVEGDAVFSELIDRAEVLYAVDQQRLDTAATAAQACSDTSSSEAASPKSCGNGNRGGVCGVSASPLFPQFRKLPRVAEPYLRPNARCIALHYGLPNKAEPLAGAKSEGADERAPVSHHHSGDGGGVGSEDSNPYPRASLMAVVCTTRLEDNEEIYVSLESYYRCLDEAAWYRRCYGALNRRCSCATGETDTDASGSPTAAADLVGDVYDGVKRFPEWPPDLAYYHGVGRRHASDTAEAAFPFTLVGLGPAPELGDNQKGVVATAWLPYGTCLLYCGPSVATRKVERLVSERALRGGGATGVGAGAASDGSCSTQQGREELSDNEDLSFVTDDTYALGLGRHGVCFGQGLTRYINHRYNTSRFGNVELCSVMLSVPSEFADAAAQETAAGAGRVSGECSRKGGAAAAASSPLSSRPSTTLNPAATSSNAEERAQVARAAAAITAAKQSLSVRRGRPPSVKKGGASVAGSSNTKARCGAPCAPCEGGVAAALSVKAKSRHQRRRARFFFHEDRSFFVSVPFFLVTTDTAPGTSLLAWTYGEEYDAKLERHAVADGHLVPYADAELLNHRLAQLGCGYQRYTGDYRFAVGLGDVVWRRRPVRLTSSSPTTLCCSSWRMRGGSVVCDSDGVSDVYVPPPEEDLFVVVQAGRAGLDHVLLRQLRRVPLTNRQLLCLLEEQCLDTYVSPHMPAAAVASLPWGGGGEDDKGRRRGGRRPSEKTKRLRAEAAKMSFDWAAHWAVLRLTDTSAVSTAQYTAGTAAVSPPSFGAGGLATAAYLTPQALARYEEALRSCVVATLDSLGLLLMDIDYSAVHLRRGNATATAVSGSVADMLGAPAASTSPAATGKQAGGCSAAAAAGSVGAAAVDAHQIILANLDDLRHATALVRTSSTRAGAVPAMCHGLLWPLVSSSASGPGGEAPAAAGSSRRIASRASW